VDPLRLTGRYFIKPIPPNKKKEHPTRQCEVYCSHKEGQKKLRKESSYYCED